MKQLLTTLALLITASVCVADIQTQSGSCRLDSKDLKILSVEKGNTEYSGWNGDPNVGDIVYFEMTQKKNILKLDLRKSRYDESTSFAQVLADTSTSYKKPTWDFAHSDSHLNATSGSAGNPSKFHLVKTIDGLWKGYFMQYHPFDWAWEYKAFTCSYYPNGKGREYKQ